MTSPDPSDVISTGELSRSLGRVEGEMKAGFTAIRDEIRALAFVPVGVYASDAARQRERVERLEQDLTEERRERQAAQLVGDQRAWQARLAVTLAVAGVPLSIITALVTTAMR